MTHSSATLSSHAFLTADSKPDIALFPYAMIRIGGLSSTLLGDLDSLELGAHFIQFQSTAARNEESREQLCAELFQAIQNTSDAPAQKTLLHCKRLLGRGKGLRTEKVLALRQLLPDSSCLDAYLQASRQLEALDAEGALLFDRELAATRKAAQQACRLEVLRKGLVLSSRSLLGALDRYAEKPLDCLRKTDYKAELSLLKYLTRIAAKTSPFSTFTRLGLARIHAEESKILRPQEGNSSKQHHVRLNNFLFGYLQNLLQAHPAYRAHIPLRPNPTLTLTKNHYVYLTNSRNIEAFQRMDQHAVVDLLQSLVAEKKSGITFSKLIHNARIAIDASEEALTAYVNQLITFGLFEFHFGISGLDPNWDMGLVHWLETLKADLPLRSDLIQTLHQLRILAEAYADAATDQRLEILEKAYETLKSMCLALHEDADLPEMERMSLTQQKAYWDQKKLESKTVVPEPQENAPENPDVRPVFHHFASTYFSYKPEQIFYEDCTSPFDFSMSRTVLTQTLEKLDSLYQWLADFVVDLSEREQMRTYFLDQTGSEKSAMEMDLLSFYEGYFRDVKLPQKKAETPGLTAVTQWSTRQQDFIQHIKKHLGSPSGVAHQGFDFGDDLFDAAGLSRQSLAKPSAHGAFVQFYEEIMPDGTKRVRAVINARPYGFGKFFSRFLHLIDPEVTQALRDWNKSSDPHALLLENCDASMFNANLHPPLMPYEVWMPGSQNMLPASRHIPVTEIQVSFDESAQELQLRHGKSGKKIHIFDLGFAADVGRSELYQLLKRLSPGKNYNIFPLIWAINEFCSEPTRQEKPADESIRYLPRILFEDILVLQRQTWIIPQSGLPLRLPQENDWDWFKRVKYWQQNLGLPDLVFVNAANHSEAMDRENGLGKDDYKPQYISFKSPLLLRLLEKIFTKVPKALTLSEMLPSPEQQTLIGGQPFVTEALLEWRSQA